MENININNWSDFKFAMLIKQIYLRRLWIRIEQKYSWKYSLWRILWNLKDFLQNILYLFLFKQGIFWC